MRLHKSEFARCYALQRRAR